MDGPSTIRAIIRLYRAANVVPPKMFACTASATTDTRQICRAAGADGLLPKPYTQKELEAFLLEFFREEQ
jgi:CheY-like chemotaxis protein